MMLETIFKAIFLGVLNGLTEFLPVSSTGHLIIAEHILGVSQDKFGLSFDAALHLGTAAAVFWFFWKKWMRIVEGLIERIKRVKKGKREKEGKLGLYLLLATVPAAIIGLLLEETIETAFRQPKLIAVTLIVGGLIIFLADKLGKKIKSLEAVQALPSFLIGCSQSLALIPGISRSGITISTGMFLGFSRQAAAEFAFLLSGPIVLGAGGKKLVAVLSDFMVGQMESGEMAFFGIGILASAVSGWLAIKFLLSYLNKHSLEIFVIYRIILAIAILIFL